MAVDAVALCELSLVRASLVVLHERDHLLRSQALLMLTSVRGLAPRSSSAFVTERDTPEVLDTGE